MSGTDPTGGYILAVLLKRTYGFGDNGVLRDADTQAPLVVTPEPDSENSQLLAADTDLYPYKLATDVVVKGHAYGRSRKQFEVSVRLGAAEKRVRITGDRRCTLGSNGRLIFSDPAPVETMPLRYDRAYGGWDAAAESRYGNPVDEVREYLPPELRGAHASPFTYPRNPSGAGYLIEQTTSAVDALRLPNLEDPLDPVSPDRLAVGDARRWPGMPLPCSFDWVDLGWFPRVAYFGLVPDHESPAKPIAEVARGFAPDDILVQTPLVDKFSFRCANGGSLGLQTEYLRGDEYVELVNMHPKLARLVLRLPNQRPRIWIDGRKGTLRETQPVIHTVLIEPDEDRLSIVWRGAAPALRPYMEDELAKMPFRVEWS